MGSISPDHSLHSGMFAPTDQASFAASQQANPAALQRANPVALQRANSNAGQFSGNAKSVGENSNGIFQQNFGEALNNSEQIASKQASSAFSTIGASSVPTPVSLTPPKPTSFAEYTDEVLERVKNGESLVDAMASAKSDLFKNLFAEELVKGGGGRSAVEQAKAKLGMDISDQELLDIVSELAREYSEEHPSLAKELDDLSKELEQKIKADISGKKQGTADSSEMTGATDSTEGSRSTGSANATDTTGAGGMLGIFSTTGTANSANNTNLLSSFALSQKNTDSQIKNHSANMYHSRYLENQRAMGDGAREPFNSVV